MEYQKLFTVPTTTLRLKTVTPALVIYQILILPFTFHGLLFISLLLYRLIELGDGSRIWGTACVPLDVMLVLYFHVFSGLSVLLMLMYVQLRQNGPCARHHGAVPLPAAYLLAHAVSPQNNVNDIKKGWLTRCILNCNNIYWFWWHWKNAVGCWAFTSLRQGLVTVGVNLLFSSHMIITHTNKMFSEATKHQWLESIVHKILLLSDRFHVHHLLSAVTQVFNQIISLDMQRPWWGKKDLDTPEQTSTFSVRAN